MNIYKYVYIYIYIYIVNISMYIKIYIIMIYIYIIYSNIYSTVDIAPYEVHLGVKTRVWFNLLAGKLWVAFLEEPSVNWDLDLNLFGVPSRPRTHRNSGVPLVGGACIPKQPRGVIPEIQPPFYIVV